MLTIKELQYVDSWASKIPMPGVEYSLEVLKEMEKCYKIYLEKYRNKEYNILFSNSDEIDLVIQEKNLCHMLGVDFSNIRNDYFTDFRLEAFGNSSSVFTSFDLLELIFENMEKVAELDNDPTNKAKAINYYKSSIKCDIFKKLSDFSNFNFISVNSKNENVKNLVIPSYEALTPYFMMGIILSTNLEDNGKYVVNTLIAPTNPKEYFDGNEASIPTQMLITDNAKLSKIKATPEEKIKLLTIYSNIVNKYNITNMMNIYGDYENQLNEMSKSI